MRFSVNESQSAFVNPHTCQLTSNLQNTKVAAEDWENVKAGLKQLRPLESLWERALNLPSRTYIDRANNSANLAEGMTIQLNGGFRIKLTADHGFVIDYGEVGDERHFNETYFDETCRIRDSLTTLLLHSDGMLTNLYHGIKEKNYDQWEESIKKGLERIGIDISKDFTINGVKYTRNSEGKIDSERMAVAREAYELEKANNRRYESADERTSRMIQYRSDYYLSTAPDSVKSAWQEAMEETNVNPFVVPYGNTIAQLAMEQDFATGGNDKLFGESVESSIEAVKKIIDRIDNPLGDVAEENLEEYQQVSQKEREFYTEFLEKLKNLAAS